MKAMRTPTIAVPGEVLWYWGAVIYEVPVRAFCDSDGDGDYIAGSTDIHPAPGMLRKAGTLEYRQCKNEPVTLGSHTNCNTPNEVRAPSELCDVQESGKSHQRRTAI